MCDAGTYSLYDVGGDCLATINGYVPNGVVPGSYGDYIELKIDENGFITNWPKLPNVEELLREALRNGAFGIMKKPLDFDKLFRLIDQAVPDGALILAVDDDKDFCTNIKDNLEEKGFRVSVAYDGNAAIKKAHEENFDVILLDMKLPPINGLETYLLIRDIRPNVIVTIITGYPKEMGDLAREAVEKNAYVCLEKPIDMDNLISIIKQIKVHKAAGIRKKPE